MLPLNLPDSQRDTQWKSQIDPLLSNLITQGRLLPSTPLILGSTIVNHGLQRKLIGWIVVGIDAAATIYDNQASNQTPQLTLSLTSDAACNVNLWVF